MGGVCSDMGSCIGSLGGSCEAAAEACNGVQDCCGVAGARDQCGDLAGGAFSACAGGFSAVEDLFSGGCDLGPVADVVCGLLDFLTGLVD